MRLATDFHDYYDHAFDSRHASTPELLRYAAKGDRRSMDHSRLEAAGFRVPPRANSPGQLRATLGRHGYFVVYTDPYAHAGEGKVLLSVDQAEREHPDAYCCLFVGEPGHSTRLLMVGDIPFWLTYSSRSDWRSNAGEVVIEEEMLLPSRKVELEAAALRLGHPLVAIDFVHSRHRVAYAVDLNTAPGLRGTPVERMLRPSVVHAAIEARWAVIGASR